MERKSAAKSAISVLYEDVNDIDIYIEDTALGYKKVYREILRRIFKDEYKIEQVFPLGGSDKVIKECEKYQKIDDGRHKVFIIDGDFYLLNNNLHDRISEEHKDNLKGLFVLPRYCIENFFIEETLLVDIANEEDASDDKDEILRNLNFEEWMKSNESLVDLFIIYSIVMVYLSTEQTIGYKVTDMCKDNTGVICELKNQNRITDLSNKLLGVLSQSELDYEIQKRKEIINGSNTKLLKFVSGKDYLLPLVKSRIRSKHKFQPDNISFKNRLSQRCDVSELNNIKNFVFKSI